MGEGNGEAERLQALVARYVAMLQRGGLLRMTHKKNKKNKRAFLSHFLVGATWAALLLVVGLRNSRGVLRYDIAEPGISRGAVLIGILHGRVP